MTANKQKRSNRIGTICYLKNKNIYQGKIVVGRNEKGKIKRKSVYGKTQAEVADKLLQIKYQLKTGDYIDNNNVTFYELSKQILDNKLKLNIIKDTTYHRSNETLKILKPLFNIPLQKITSYQINEFSQSLIKYSQSTIDKIFITLNKTFNEAIKRKLISNNPIDTLMKPKSIKSNKKIRALTKDEQKKLFSILISKNIKYSQQMLISMFTGMRMGEINALKITDVNLNKNTINVSKTIGKGKHGEPILSDTTKTKAGKRKIPISNDVKYIFNEVLKSKPNDYFFQNKGKLITTSQVYHEFIRTLKKYDIVDKYESGTISLHSLRHTYATRCIEAGMQPKVLQKLLGHTDIRVTLNTYCDAFDEFTNENFIKANTYLETIGLKINKN